MSINPTTLWTVVAWLVIAVIHVVVFWRSALRSERAKGNSKLDDDLQVIVCMLAVVWFFTDLLFAWMILDRYRKARARRQRLSL